MPEAARFPDCPSQPQRLRNKPRGRNPQQSVRVDKGLKRCFLPEIQQEYDEKEPGFSVKSIRTREHKRNKGSWGGAKQEKLISTSLFTHGHIYLAHVAQMLNLLCT